jgi:hypothetical protein
MTMDGHWGKVRTLKSVRTSLLVERPLKRAKRLDGGLMADELGKRTKDEKARATGGVPRGVKGGSQRLVIMSKKRMSAWRKPDASWPPKMTIDEP